MKRSTVNTIRRENVQFAALKWTDSSNILLDSWCCFLFKLLWLLLIVIFLFLNGLINFVSVVLIWVDPTYVRGNTG